MITILADHNLEGQANLLWRTLATEGWLALELLQLATFSDVGLPFTCTDREVWLFVQRQEMILLTGNRNLDGEDSLEQTIRNENSVAALPVVTISDVERMVERTYREACATSLAEIVLYLDNYRGVGRIFIPFLKI